MTPTVSRPVTLNESHDVASFDCGKLPLEAFLKVHALDKQRAMLSRTYVVEAGDRVAGYFTLAPVAVAQTDAPKKLARGMPASIPAMLLARLAVDKGYQGMGSGRSLFVDALLKTWSVMESGPAPVRLFAVDAIDQEARAFYERFDMRPSPHDPMRLFLLYKDLRTILS